MSAAWCGRGTRCAGQAGKQAGKQAGRLSVEMGLLPVQLGATGGAVLSCPYPGLMAPRCCLQVGVVRQVETAAIKKAGDNKGGPFERRLTALYTAATLEVRACLCCKPVPACERRAHCFSAAIPALQACI